MKAHQEIQIRYFLLALFMTAIMVAYHYNAADICTADFCIK
ncbi:MAG: hypothetical protein PQ612_05880 [Rickettsiales bacterium]|nr:hypothetical protein [Pseudomonadota bacterium]MDA0966852.1 hypothetical protein [Pseudomonadota bacterium]MDG4543527.1 hypothetical protein [Rickettsiales bacterium]MDG4545675.1 hypothetical protein [Rickettsiales bacterium]MDG4547552.1 hypothetical protein [Rickettsiales bacterium]